MSGIRPWGIIVWRSMRGAPMWSLGVHLDLHTPTLDIHLPWHTVQIGRNVYWPGRFQYHDAGRWHGHSDNCDHGVDAGGVGRPVLDK